MELKFVTLMQESMFLTFSKAKMSIGIYLLAIEKQQNLSYFLATLIRWILDRDKTITMLLLWLDDIILLSLKIPDF